MCNESHLLSRMNFILPSDPRPGSLFFGSLTRSSSERVAEFLRNSPVFCLFYEVHVLPGRHRPVLSPHDFIFSFPQYICEEEPGLGRQSEAVEDHGGHNGVG